MLFCSMIKKSIYSMAVYMCNWTREETQCEITLANIVLVIVKLGAL